MGNNNKNYGPFSYVLSFVFIVWLVGSVIGMIYCGTHGLGSIAVALGGLLFFVFGVIIVGQGLYYNNFQAPTVIFPFAGMGMIAYGLINYKGDEKLVKLMEMFLPYLILMLFLAIGVGMIVGGIIMCRKEDEQCTEVIMATCVGIQEKKHDGTMLECPVYEIEFQGETLQICNNYYTNQNTVTVGEQRELHINPDDPNNYYEGKKESFLGVGIALFGGVIVMMILLTLFMMIALR